LQGIEGNLELSGTVLTATVQNAHNTFDQPENVSPAEFRQFQLENDTIDVQLPPMSITILKINS